MRVAKPLPALALLALVGLAALPPSVATASKNPEIVIQDTLRELLDEFASRRDELESDRSKLFALVDRVAVPLFDVPRIAKLVLAKNYKRASDVQRSEFAAEFRKLLVGTYATALFRYTGDESMNITESRITERKGRQFATVSAEVSLGSGSPPVPIIYSLILNVDDEWKIYNMDVNGLNMVTSYRSTYGSAISSQGLDGVIEEMKQANARNFQAPAAE